MLPADLAILDVIIYYLVTFAVIMGLGRSVRKKAGTGSRQDMAMRAPRFLSMLIMSAAGIAVVLMAMKGSIAQATRTYIGVPYFAVLVYTMTTYFRQMKDLRKEKGGRG
jgi:L-asparagine transporter-like permease